MKFFAVATVLYSVVAVASASRFVAYQKGYYTGATSVIGKCGCSNIPYQGSFKWYGEGQSGRMYNSKGCSSAAHSVLPSDGNREGTGSYGWKSVNIIC